MNAAARLVAWWSVALMLVATPVSVMGQVADASVPTLPPPSSVTALPSSSEPALPRSSTLASTPGAVPQVSVEEAARRLAAGGFVVLMRHASTVGGTGDPAGFSLDDCGTQRNLSPQGRAEAAATGQALRARGVRFDEIRASAWCRCIETARLGFGEPRIWPALNSFFDDRSQQAPRTAAVQRLMQQVRAPRNLLLVTHQVNITALTGLFPAPSELVAMRWLDGAARNEFRFQVAVSAIKP